MKILMHRFVTPLAEPFVYHCYLAADQHTIAAGPGALARANRSSLAHMLDSTIVGDLSPSLRRPLLSDASGGAATASSLLPLPEGTPLAAAIQASPSALSQAIRYSTQHIDAT